MWPLSARIGFGGAAFATGVAGSALTAVYGSPSNPLHALIAGQSTNLVIITTVAVIGATVVEFFKGVKS